MKYQLFWDIVVYFVLHGSFLKPLGFEKTDNYSLVLKELEKSSFGYMRLGGSTRAERQHSFICNGPAAQDLS